LIKSDFTEPRFAADRKDHAPAETSRYERIEMKNLFPDPIRSLPEADIPLDGIKAYLSQATDHQLIFMQFEKDVDLPEHSHAAQVGFVLSGTIELTVDGVKKEYGKGDIYYIPENVKHSGQIHAVDMPTLPFLMSLIAIRQ
jgi:mannose-6-phosphate isomerase-like protein (cupin superfamily)